MFDHEQASATDAQARVLDRQDARKYRVAVRQLCQSCVFSGKCLSLTVLLLSSAVLLCVVVFVLWALRCVGSTECEKSQQQKGDGEDNIITQSTMSHDNGATRHCFDDFRVRRMEVRRIQHVTQTRVRPDGC